MTKEFDEEVDFDYSKLISKKPSKIQVRFRAGGEMWIKYEDEDDMQWRRATRC